MKIGLYFGTFNPIHVGHMIIANHIAEYSGLDQVWMVVTPHNPLKAKNTLLDDYKRLEMVFLATENYPKIKPSDIEFKLPQPNYTVNTLAHLTEKFPQHDFALVMGEDNLDSLHKWKNYQVLLDNHKIFIYPRIHKELKAQAAVKGHPNVTIIDAPVVEISSTKIREMIKAGKNCRALLPDSVFTFIDHNNLYKK